MSRHQIGVATPLKLIKVATPKQGHDPPEGYPMSRHQFHVATSLLRTVGFLGRDTKYPGRDLPHCHPCRDLKNDVATSNQFSSIFATSRRHFSMSRPPLLPSMSRPQIDVATSSRPSQLPCFFFFFFKLLQ